MAKSSWGFTYVYHIKSWLVPAACRRHCQWYQTIETETMSMKVVLVRYKLLSDTGKFRFDNYETMTGIKYRAFPFFWSCILHSLQWYFWLVCMGRSFAWVLRSGIRVWLTLLNPSCTCLMPIIILVVVIPVSCLLCWSQLWVDCGDFLHCNEVCTDLFYFLCNLHQWKIQYKGHWQWVCQQCFAVWLIQIASFCAVSSFSRFVSGRLVACAAVVRPKFIVSDTWAPC